MQTISIKELYTDSSKIALMVDAYKKGYICLGEFAEILQIDHQKAMKILSMMGIDIVDYDFEDDMKFMDSFL